MGAHASGTLRVIEDSDEEESDSEESVSSAANEPSEYDITEEFSSTEQLPQQEIVHISKEKARQLHRRPASQLKLEVKPDHRLEVDAVKMPISILHPPTVGAGGVLSIHVSANCMCSVEMFHHALEHHKSQPSSPANWPHITAEKGKKPFRRSVPPGEHCVRFDQPDEAPVDLRLRRPEECGVGTRWPFVFVLKPDVVQSGGRSARPTEGTLMLLITTQRGVLQYEAQLLYWKGQVIEVREMECNGHTRSRSRRRRPRKRGCC